MHGDTWCSRNKRRRARESGYGNNLMIYDHLVGFANAMFYNNLMIYDHQGIGYISIEYNK
jgi:hypothetical protein